MTAPHELPPGTTFGRYTVVRLLGSGGMGAVYEATHLDLEKRVALKVLRPDVAASPEARARFLREGRITARLRHPHVLDVTDVGLQDETPFLVMEYLEGESLAALLEREGALPVSRLADLLLPVLAAIAAAHDVGIVHRDLKPDNLFLARTRDGGLVPKVLDFGISKLADVAQDAALTGTGALLGTPSYLSPEQARGARDVDAQSDQYALGVILYEGATGRLPFAHETLYGLLMAIAHDALTPPRAHRPDLPPAFEALVLRAMARDPAERFPSVRELGTAVLGFASPKSRTIWESSFDASGNTSIAAAAGPVPLGAAALESPGRLGRRAATTLGATVTALDFGPPPRPRSRIPFSLLLGVALLTAALVAAAMLVPTPQGLPTSPHARAAPLAAPDPPPPAAVVPAPVVSLARAAPVPPTPSRTASREASGPLPRVRARATPVPSSHAGIVRPVGAARRPTAPTSPAPAGTNLSPILE